MQKRHIAGTAPIATIKAIGTDKVKRARHRFVAIISEEQDNAVLHALSDDIEKAAGEIRLPPFARAGILIEYPERIPHSRRDICACNLFDPHRVCRACTFLTNSFALA